jgi:hypothetical protein
LQIDTERLLKLQNGELDEELLSNTSLSSKALKLDLINGPVICYPLSGYLGAGKTTHIKQVETIVNAEIDSKIVFVHVDFSRYREKGNLFRRLIRELYLAINGLPSHKTLKADETNKPHIDRTTRLLQELHEKTFIESTKTHKQTTLDTTIKEGNFNVLRWLVLISSGRSALFCVLNLAYGWISQLLP